MPNQHSLRRVFHHLHSRQVHSEVSEPPYISPTAYLTVVQSRGRQRPPPELSPKNGTLVRPAGVLRAESRAGLSEASWGGVGGRKLVPILRKIFVALERKRPEEVLSTPEEVALNLLAGS